MYVNRPNGSPIYSSVKVNQCMYANHANCYRKLYWGFHINWFTSDWNRLLLVVETLF